MKQRDLINISMSLTRKQKQTLENMIEVVQTEADIVKLDYDTNPTDMDSGSAVVVHQNSKLLQNEDEKLGDIAFNIQPNSNINAYGDDEWAAPRQEEE